MLELSEKQGTEMTEMGRFNKPYEQLTEVATVAGQTLEDWVKDVLGLELEPETQSMCLKNNLLLYIKQLRNMVYETFRDVRFIETKLVKDPEISDYEKICFEIHLKGEPTQILEDEETFYALFYEEVPKEKQLFFTFTYRVL